MIVGAPCVGADVNVVGLRIVRYRTARARIAAASPVDSESRSLGDRVSSIGSASPPRGSVPPCLCHGLPCLVTRLRADPDGVACRRAFVSPPRRCPASPVSLPRRSRVRPACVRRPHTRPCAAASPRPCHHGSPIDAVVDERAASAASPASCRRLPRAALQWPLFTMVGGIHYLMFFGAGRRSGAGSSKFPLWQQSWRLCRE